MWAVCNNQADSLTRMFDQERAPPAKTRVVTLRSRGIARKATEYRHGRAPIGSPLFPVINIVCCNCLFVLAKSE